MFGEVLLRSEFVLQHFGEITHVLARCRLWERKRDGMSFCYFIYWCGCVYVCLDVFLHFLLWTHKQCTHLCGRECVLLIRYLAKVFLLQKWFLPRKQTTNYHNSLTRGGENPFAEDSENHRRMHKHTHRSTRRKMYYSHSWQIGVNEQTLL